QLTNSELYQILQLRSAVFVVEQQCVYQDIDDKDVIAHHLFAMENKVMVAYCRILPAGVSAPEAAIGRIIVSPAQRGRNLSRLLIQKAIDIVTNEWLQKRIYIMAQAHLVPLYASLGFVVHSMAYLEDGIPHVDMLWGQNSV
ncbi:MAG TPA: GNAT family N-acetyltransferase, partial [Pasteurellaceae bacterium]|nr:GNAT family N-acetyltransferase [Pasteurellaceae bacterium]